MWHQGFNRNFTKLQDYFLCAKKTKITTLFNNSSPLHHPGAILRMQLMYVDTLFKLWSECKQCIHVNTLQTLFTYVILFKMAPGWRRGDELLNKIVMFVFFAHKKCSRSFVKLRLNHWCDMDYLNDVLACLSLDRVRMLTVYGRVRELSELIKNILTCVLKMNEGLTGLERHEGE